MPTLTPADRCVEDLGEAAVLDMAVVGDVEGVASLLDEGVDVVVIVVVTAEDDVLEGRSMVEFAKMDVLSIDQ
jgi:hypothetical protein